MHSSSVPCPGFLLFTQSFFFFFVVLSFQYRKWTALMLSWTDPFGFFFNSTELFVLFWFFFPHYLVADEGSSTIPRPLLRSSWRGRGIKPVTPPSSSSFFFFFPPPFLPPVFGPMHGITNQLYSCMVLATVYLCRFWACHLVMWCSPRTLPWFSPFFFFSLLCGRYLD